MFERINPESLAAPIGFSHAVKADGTYIFLAGQTALTKEGVIFGKNIVEQFEKALSNLLTALQLAGGTPSQIAKLTIFVADTQSYRDNARAIGEVWKRLVGRDFPAMTLVGVVRLWDIEALVEIEGIAII